MTVQTPEEPVRAKVVIVDPADMSVVWMNESAANDANDDALDRLPLPLDEAVPLAATLGLAEALEHVARTGEPRHVRTNLVSTAKGSLAIATSVYTIPGDHLLVVTENAWQADRASRSSQSGDRGAPGERGGRKRR